MSRLTILQRVFLVLAALLYVSAGVLHFVRPQMYVRIMPPYIPWPLAMVWISGFFEVLGGVGLLVPMVRRAAAWGLVALLVAVFPANWYMALHPVAAGAASIPTAILWGRLPLQILLIWWVLWCTRE